MKAKLIGKSLMAALVVTGAGTCVKSGMDFYASLPTMLKNYKKIFVTTKKDEDPLLLLKVYSDYYNVPRELSLAVAKQENLKDWENNDAVSNKGAVGIMQIIPKYHVGPGKTCSGIVSNWTELVGKEHRRENINCGIKILRTCLDYSFKNKTIKSIDEQIDSAIMGYNNSRSYAKAVVYSALMERIRDKSL